MMRRLIGAILLLQICVFTTANAQEGKLEQMQAGLDSLHAVKKELTRQLRAVELEISNAEAMISLHQAAQVDEESVVLVTNMEASLRSRPSPDGRVIRILPEKTPLVAAGYNGAYWKVRYQGIEGWVMRLFVDEGAGAGRLKQKLLAAGADSSAYVEPGTLAEDRQGKDFLVTDFGIHPPNSAGGVSIYYAFEHLDSTRTVREVTFSITPYNAEGSKEKGMNSGASTKRLRRFGPITVHDGERQYQFENVWYNNAIQCAQIDRIDIVYTDGSRKSHRQHVADVLASSIENNCAITTAEDMGAAN